MTRILHVIETLNPEAGGPVEGALRFGEAWARAGHVQDLLTLDPPEESHVLGYPGEVIPLGRSRGRSPAQLYRYSPRVVPWLKANASHYDAVIVSGLWRYMSRAVVTGLRRRKTPYYVYTHGMLDPWFRHSSPLKHWGKQASWWFAEGPLLRRARGVLFTTEEERLLADRAFWPYKVDGVVVGYGAADVAGVPDDQVAAFRAALPALGDRRFLLFLSRIHPKKGCDLLLEAFSTIAAYDRELDLVIAGPDQVGLTAELKIQAVRLGITDRVHFPGMLSGDVKIGAYRAAEAFTLTSHQENFGVVVAEALACGTPVLISNKVNIWREVIADGAGMVEPDTVEGSTLLLSRFAALPADERATMAARARSTFLSRFQIDRAAQRLMDLIETQIQ